MQCWRAALEQALQAAWYQRPEPPLLLQPLSGIYQGLAALAALPWRLGWRHAWRAPCPVIVVGNLIVGGAGKTPTVIALVQALHAEGWRPGVISRGHGRRSRGVVVASAADDARMLGDEPWLIHRRTGAPVAVGAQRPAAIMALLDRHPEVDVIVADDGLQHHALARDLSLWVFDDRGVGNGAVLPAGPLRQRLPDHLPASTWVIYNAQAPTTALPGALGERQLAGAVLLNDWHAGATASPQALLALRGRPLHAVAGIGAPDRFFAMLSAAGLQFTAQALPDHADLSTPPWPAGTADVLCTEKDAAKLQPSKVGATRVWVVGLDFRLPPALLHSLRAALQQARRPRGSSR